MIEIKGWFLKCQRKYFGDYSQLTYQNTWLDNSDDIWLDISLIKTLKYETDNTSEDKPNYIEISLRENDNYDYRLYFADIDILLLALKELNRR
jgi:hypothetical protein